MQKENAGSPTVLTLLRAVKKNGPKNKWLRAQAALVTGLMLQAGLAAAQQNLVTNPGFETGDTTGWFPFGSPTLSVESSVVHSGSYAAEVSNRTQTYDGIAQSFLGVLQSNQTYNVTAWVRLVSGTNQTVQLTMQETTGSGTSYAYIGAGSVSTNGWTQLVGQYTYSPTNAVSGLTMYVEVPSSSSVSYYIDDVSVVSTTITPANGQSTVEWTNVDQRIDGFGASSAWQSTWTSAEADMFFGTNNGIGTSSNGTNFDFTGIGLSLLRNHITYAGSTSASDTPTTVETNIMRMAQARGALVWSAPWTPAAGFKSTSDIYDSSRARQRGIDGGSYLGGTANNQAYASQLANYVVSMKNQGINIYAISVQNEPDANVNTYEACQWTGTEIHNFVTNLYSALAANGVGSTKIILPESQNWSDPHDLAGPTLSDPTTAADVGIIADHNYGSSGAPPAAKSVSGQSVWETEVATFDNFDGSISNAIYWASQIHSFMTVAQANAWGYWWLMPSGSDNEGLTDNNGVPAKRMYALGQFSRFVRPGYYRISMGNNTGSALVSAYKDPNSGNFAIVAINSSSVVVTQAFDFSNVTGISSVTPWMTSASQSLAPQTPVSVSSSSFSYALPAMSIVTFVGTGTTSITLTNPPAAPTGLMAVPGNAQVSLSWTASTGATSYNVYRSTTSGGPYTQIATGVTTTSYTDGTVANGTTYYYVVTAVDSYGESGYSNEAGATPCVTPAAPTGLTATGGNGQIAVSWNASSGVNGYNVYRSTSSGGPYTEIAAGITTTSYTDAGLAGGTTYFYYVTAVNNCGPSAPSAYIGATTIPSAPAGLTATAGNVQVVLSWTATTGATSYNVKRATVSGGPYTTIASPTTANYTDTSVVNGTTYYYVVSALNSTGESANSSEVSATPTTAVAPAAPTSLVVSSSGKGRLVLNWTQSTSPNITLNNIYRSTTSGGPYTQIASVSPTTSYADTGLTGGTTYYYVVTAVNSNSLESPYSNESSNTAR